MESVNEILEQEVESRIEQPFVTARFGNNWREHQKRLLDEGQITIDIILDIAWKQGRRALLQEEVIRKYLTHRNLQTPNQ